VAVTDYTNNRPRYMRKTLLMARLEDSYGVISSSPFVPATHAIQVEEVSFDYNANNQTFNALRPYMGAKIEVAGNDYVTISFKVPQYGSRATNRDPHFGFLFRACGMKRTVVAAAAAVAASAGPPAVAAIPAKLAHTKYTPDSDATADNTSIELVFGVDGVSYRAYGARGTWDLDMMEGGIPAFKFTFTCLFDANITSEAFVAPEFADYKPPRIVQARNADGVLLGISAPTMTSSGFDLTDGGRYASKGFTLSFGNTVNFDGRLGGDRVLISDREVTGNVKLDLSAGLEKDFFNQIRANTARSFGFLHGTNDGAIVAGEACLIYAPAMRFLNPKIEDVNGTVYASYDMRFQTLDSRTDASDDYGDNELQLVFL
jgi:hypothetical protein